MHIPGLRAVAHVRVGNRQSQVEQAAPVQREIADGLLLDHFAEAGIGGLQRFGKADHLHLRLTHVQREHEVQPHYLPDFQAQLLREYREAGGFRGQGVISRP